MCEGMNRGAFLEGMIPIWKKRKGKERKKESKKASVKRGGLGLGRQRKLFSC